MKKFLPDIPRTENKLNKMILLHCLLLVNGNHIISFYHWSGKYTKQQVPLVYKYDDAQQGYILVPLDYENCGCVYHSFRLQEVLNEYASLK